MQENNSDYISDRETFEQFEKNPLVSSKSFLTPSLENSYIPDIIGNKRALQLLNMNGNILKSITKNCQCIVPLLNTQAELDDFK